MMPGYDAFLLISFGGPEAPADVIPFLEKVTRGRRVPPERLAAVAGHYDAVGGVSPINQQCRDLLGAIEKDFAAAGINLPIYWGNRNWHPMLGDTVTTMAADGITRALAFVTSAYGSYSSCGQYLEDIARARAQAGPGAPVIDKIRHYFNHPGFIEPLAASTRAALARLPAAVRDGAHLVFSAHSIPEAMAAASGPAMAVGRVSGQESMAVGRVSGQESMAVGRVSGQESMAVGRVSGQESMAVGRVAGQKSMPRPHSPQDGRYVTQLTEASRLVAERAGSHPWRLVYQSRSGPPSQPWLGPDVREHLAELASGGAPAAVIVPVGFVSDHMEVRYDLDLEARETAERLGLPIERAATPGTDPRFVSMVTELVRERLDGAPPAALGGMGPAAHTCPLGCCPWPPR